MCPFFDNVENLMNFEYSFGLYFHIGKFCSVSIRSLRIISIGLSCVLSLGVNITNYLVLGKTSPVTYQVDLNNSYESNTDNEIRFWVT
jgi:hypothetical protein